MIRGQTYGQTNVDLEIYPFRLTITCFGPGYLFVNFGGNISLILTAAIKLVDLYNIYYWESFSLSQQPLFAWILCSNCLKSKICTLPIVPKRVPIIVHYWFVIVRCPKTIDIRIRLLFKLTGSSWNYDIKFETGSSIYKSFK